jgi:hypothetical protein
MKAREYSEISNILEPLWGDVNPNEVHEIRKSQLIHYTSINVLQNILKDGEIWFSNPLLMNDYQELRFGLLNAVRILKENREIRVALETVERHELFVSCLDNELKSFDENQVFDVYVFCLSIHTPENEDGLLSMWRGYGSNAGGVAIIFDGSKLPPPEEGPFILGRVRYANDTDRLKWIDDTAARFAEIVANSGFLNEEIWICTFYLFVRLKMFSLFSKHIGFEEEREVRLAYLPERDTENRFKGYFSTFIGPNGPEPKLKLPIDKLLSEYGSAYSLSNLIERIILGPTSSSVLSVKTVQRMCIQSKRDDLAGKVCASAIPYRTRR